MYINLKEVADESTGKIQCFIANYDGYIYIIPEAYREIFESTPYDDRQEHFRLFILPEEAIIECSIDYADYSYFIEGDFEY